MKGANLQITFNDARWDFCLYELDELLPTNPGVFVVLKDYQNSDDNKSLHIYYGCIENLSAMYDQKSLMECWLKHGAQFVAIRVQSDPENRNEELKEMLRNYKPICNQ